MEYTLHPYSCQRVSWSLNISVRTLRTRPNVELFMRRTKPSELNSWKGRRLAQLSSSEHVLSVCIRRIKRKLQKRFPGTNVDLHMRRTALINKKIVWWCIFSLFREKICYWTPAGRLNCFLVWFSWSVRRALSSTSDPTDDLNLI